MDEAARHRATPWVVVGVLLFSNVMTNRVLPHWAYVPWGLALSAVLITISVRLDGSTAADLGLARRDVGSGLRWGGLVFGLILLVYVAGIAMPWTRDLFRDARASSELAGLLQRALWAVPLGTVLPEEIAFRGALLTTFRHRTSPLRAAMLSSVLFGFWHVLPSWNLNESNVAVGDEIGRGGLGRAIAIVGAVLATAVAGMVFCWLRQRSRSLVAPMLLHLATNSLGYVGAFVVARAF